MTDPLTWNVAEDLNTQSQPQPPQHSGGFFTSTSLAQTSSSWAGFWIRAMAFVLDLAILGFLYLILLFIGNAAMGLGLKTIFLDSPSEELLGFMANLYAMLWLFLFHVYFIFFLIYGGQTPGKMLFGVRVVTKGHQPLSWREAILRTMGYSISGLLLLGLGFLVILFHPKKRALHDLIASTFVVRDRLDGIP